MNRIKVKINFEKVEDKYELLSSGFNANDIYEADYIGNGFYEIKALAFKRAELIMIDKEKGRCYGYIDKECINCGRLRVELFENGDEICERCKFNQLTEEFEL